MSYDKPILMTKSLRLIKVKLFNESDYLHYLCLYKNSNHFAETTMDDISYALLSNILKYMKNNNVNLFHMLRIRLCIDKISLRNKSLKFYNNYEWRLR